MNTNTNTTLTILLIISVLLGGCAKKEKFDLKPEPVSLENILLVQPDCDNPVMADLIAAQHYEIGYILAERNGNLVTVTYQIEDPLWSILEIHLAVGEIPSTKKNNPMVGKFGINEEYEYSVKSKTFEVEIEWDAPILPIAAHAVVRKNLALEYFNESLPEDLIDYEVVHPGESSYFSTLVTQDGNTEEFAGWCIDTDNSISGNTPYKAELVSTYELAGMGLVEYPENLDKVNWIVNQDFVGQASVCGGDYTYGDIQRLIWELIEDNQSSSGLGPWEQCRVDELWMLAMENGNGFEPACEQEIAVALVPFDINGDPIAKQITITQITIIEKILECNQEYLEETAWGGGVRFNEKNWATLFYLCRN